MFSIADIRSRVFGSRCSVECVVYAVWMQGLGLRLGIWVLGYLGTWVHGLTVVRKVRNQLRVKGLGLRVHGFRFKGFGP